MSLPMRVLHCTTIPLSSPSAARNRLTRMSHALGRKGVEVIMAGWETGLDEPWQERTGKSGRQIVFDPAYAGVKRYCRAMTRGAQAAQFYGDHLPSLLESHECDGVISYAYQAQTAQAILGAARRVGAFVVADMVERFGPSLYRLLSGMNYQQWGLCRSVLPRMDGLIGISKGWCEWAQQRDLPNVWIPSFAEDHGCVRTDASPPERPFTLVFIGHWIRRELPCTFLRAMRMCIDRGLDVRMRVLGKVGHLPRERRPMRVLRGDKVLREHVEFLGFVSDEQRDRELADADAFILLRRDWLAVAKLVALALP